MIQIGNLTHNSGRALLDGAGRSRPLLRVVPHRHPGQEDHRRHQGQHLLRPDRRQQDRARDALPVARARHGRLAPGRRLRLRLLLRLHQQPGVAERDAAAAADSRSARAVRAAVRHGRGAERRRTPIAGRDTAAASSISSPPTRRSCRRRSARPTSASSTSTCRRSAKSSGSSRRRRRRTSQIDPGHGQALRRAGRLRRALQADDRHDDDRVPGRPDARAHVPDDARGHQPRVSRDRHRRRPPSAAPTTRASPT